MKTTFFIAFLMLSLCSYSQTLTPFAGFSGGYMSNGKGAYGFEIGAEYNRFILAGDVRLQSSSEPILLGFKTGYYLPLDDCDCKALSIMGGVYAAKRDKETHYHINELALTGSVRYYFVSYFFIEGVYQFSEECNHYGGILIGANIMNWFK